VAKDDSRDPIVERFDRLERQLAAVSEELERLKARFNAVDGGHLRGIGPRPEEALESVLPLDLPGAGSFLNFLPQLGRSSLILGGAFLVRSLTDSGTFGRPVGVALGLAYACLWILLADRSARRGAQPSANVLGVTAVAIAYPLIGETTIRWPVLSPAAAAAAVIGVTALCWGVAWRRNLRVLAWTAGAAAVLTSVILALLTGAVEPFAAGLLSLGLGSAWFAYGRRHWHVLRWPLAAAADALVLWSALRLLPSETPATESHPAVTFFFWLAFALPFLYLGSFGLRTLARRRDVTAFEILQTVAALMIGFGGAVAVARQVPGAPSMLGASASIIGAGCYAVAFAFVERQQGHGRNFSFYATLALLLTLSGSALIGRGAPLGLLWAALGLASAFVAARFERVTLAVHGAVYMLAAAWQTGLLRALAEAFGAPAAHSFAPVTAAGLAVVGIAAACYAFLARPKEKMAADLLRFPRSVWIALVTAACGALAISALRALAGGQPPGSDPGGMAALRTAVLATAALLLALLRRQTGRPELTRLAYAALVIATAKLLFEDLPHGRASTLFAGFVFYGLALLATPRLLRAALNGGAKTTGGLGSAPASADDPPHESPGEAPRS
jgi:hypothetical protein